MRLVFSSSLFLTFALGSYAHGQQAQPLASPPGDKARIYVTDSNSWSTMSSAGGSNGSFAGGSAGGARPQTAEIIKTFGQRCPDVTVNNKVDVSNYIVELDHEGGKGLLAHKDKIAVFVQKSGDSIFSKSTLSVGGSVQDACAAILAHWAAHATELQPAAPVPSAVPSIAVSAPVGQVSSITVDASMPNCDIEVDGNFVGSTPSTLNLAPGKHDIVVKKTGYKDWTRSMTVASGTIRVSADMTAQ
jgi:PEGA domain